MFQEPKDYTAADHFFFESEQELELVCNAPKEKNGVFKVLELRNGRINLVYIGYSSSGDLFNEIVNADHFTKQSRKTAWTHQMIKDRTDALDIYWYVTPNKEKAKKESVQMLKDFLENTGKFPKWNK
ncbi:MAG: hypothetical protein COA49_08645 [Bacteroidetes bacterium]|nr:MAG: hypothetical protein COA49_08645 [Bacteroidota bacterium]